MARVLRWISIAALAATLGLSAANAAERPKKLLIGLLPGESAPTVMRLNEPLRSYLEERLKLPVEIVVGANYAATSEALRFGRIDVAYLGPVTYILQSKRSPLEPFARPSHASVGATFQATIIVPASSPAKTLTDLKGGEIAFGDPASTSGTWVPRWQLLKAGLVSGRDYTMRVLGAHDAVALAVENGKVAAGGLSKPIFERLLKEGKISAGKVRVLEESPPIPEYMWTFRAGFDPAFKDEVRAAILEMKDAGALSVFRAQAFVPAVDSDVEIVREWIAAIQAAGGATAWAPK
ncbi:phosphate/phosphite/phosphonate ABC transporter substrate-binding protein [Methylocystis bryophila]|uniref:Phosphonate ABC transporter substrate-binding protein n=1 Tax=Methylocystis bryophila TaxID=655015 RepID=A0A1W6MTJ0_9HYPH|nr:phosphate/phosphite/phosphonate ABC transporter substrate-binding protein [Methylocystis bryophila]ARN80809.1 phosphonate ABC transporter substrate-binding protein [Methylocystis bryophila]BDV40894.1 phosphonates-binding protein [Methylocystis bryophila]